MAQFTFDGKAIPIEPGDTIGSALHRAGVKVISRSLKYHRPRGLYCCMGSCASCFVGVDGVPNVPACMQRAAAGSQVLSQNRMGSAKHDLLGVVDKVYRRGFDPHNAFTKLRIVNEMFLKGVRFMSGVGKPPAKDAHLEGSRRHTLEVDELIIGAGAAGVRRAHAAAGAGKKILLVDELDGVGGTARWDVLEADTRKMAAGLGGLADLTIWTQALCFGIYRHDVAADRHLAAIRRPGENGEDLWEVTAGRVTVCAGSHDAWPLFANNDLPGVLSARGARRLLGEHGVLPGQRIVVHGDALPKPFVVQLETAGGRIVGQGQVAQARGATEVTAALVGGQWIECDTVVCNIPGTPRVELFQQAGCGLGFSTGALAPNADATGATSVPGIYAGVA